MPKPYDVNTMILTISMRVLRQAMKRGIGKKISQSNPQKGSSGGSPQAKRAKHELRVLMSTKQHRECALKTAFGLRRDGVMLELLSLQILWWLWQAKFIPIHCTSRAGLSAVFVQGSQYLPKREGSSRSAWRFTASFHGAAASFLSTPLVGLAILPEVCTR